MNVHSIIRSVNGIIRRAGRAAAALCCVVLPAPAFSMVWAAYCVYCEFKSVREKSWQKAEIQKAGKTMSVIIENKDDIAKLAAEILFNKEKSEREAKDEKH